MKAAVEFIKEVEDRLVVAVQNFDPGTNSTFPPETNAGSVAWRQG